MVKNDREITQDMIATMHRMQAGSSCNAFGLLKEETEKKDEDDKFKGAIAITNDPKFGQNVLDNQIEQFKAAVDSGAEFAEPSDGDKVEDSPLIFLPSNNNLIFSGVIPRLNNLKFQFLLKTSSGDGCFVWIDGGIINNENIKTIAKLYGFYQNWCDQWNKESKDFKTMVDNMKND